MNIHEHQAKQILKKYGVKVPEGIFALDVEELLEKAKSLNTKKYVLNLLITTHYLYTALLEWERLIY